jgi:glucose/mannose transport system permease protein
MSLDTTSLRKKPVTPKLVVGKTIQYGLLFFFLVFFLIPIYVVLVTSLKPLDQVSLQTMWELPQGIDIANYVLAWEKLGPSIGNSFLLVIPGAILAAFLGSLNGY